MENKSYKKGLDYAVRLLAICARSKKEVEDRLSGKGFDQKESGSIIRTLEEKGIIDDLRLARLWVESKIIAGPIGIKKVKHDLKKKGISDDIIEKILSEKCEDLSEDKQIRRFIGQLTHRRDDRIEGKEWRRIFARFIRLGFDPEILEDILSENMER